VDRNSFILCYEGGRWKEFIVAAGSRCIWNITAFRMLWMFYEKTEEYASLYFIANCCISQCRHDCLSRKNQEFFFLYWQGKMFLFTLDKMIVNLL